MRSFSLNLTRILAGIALVLPLAVPAVSAQPAAVAKTCYTAQEFIAARYQKCLKDYSKADGPRICTGGSETLFNKATLWDMEALGKKTECVSLVPVGGECRRIDWTKSNCEAGLVCESKRGNSAAGYCKRIGKLFDACGPTVACEEGLYCKKTGQDLRGKEVFQCAKNR
jgi:hypothetical protein